VVPLDEAAKINESGTRQRGHTFYGLRKFNVLINTVDLPND
jgi:hypothetical protein